MNKNLLFTALLILSTFSLFAQLHDHIWFVGWNRGSQEWYKPYQLDFNSFPLEIEINDNSLNFPNTTSSYCDVQGHLEYYTNGISLKNKEHNIVEGGEIINPGHNRDRNIDRGYYMPKGAFFLPDPGSDSLIYLFHTAHDFPAKNISSIGGSVLYYTIIDAYANNGQGKVINANVPLFVDDYLRPATANQHANGRDWWITISHENENKYILFLLTPSGFEGPFEQFIGSEKKDTFGGIGAVQNFSPSGNQYVDYNGSLGFSLYDFDRCSGELSNEVRLDFNPNDTLGYFFGTAFSPNNRFLYVSTLWGTKRFVTSTNTKIDNPLIIQYDLWSDNISASADTVGYKDSLPNPPIFNSTSVNFPSLQLGPDGKIYCFSASTKIHSIQSPNRKGKDCRLRKRFPYTETGISTANPYYPNYRLGPLDGSLCDTLGINNNPIANYRYENWDSLNPLHIEFADLSYYEPAEWLWEFENLGTSRDTNPEFTFPAPGIYEVCLTVSNVNSSNRTCKNVPVGEVSDVEEAWEKGVPVVFPNPTSNAFQVYLPQWGNPTSQVVGIQLFNASGERIFEKRTISNGEQIDVSSLPEGLYFYHFLNQENEVMMTGKLVIVR